MAGLGNRNAAWKTAIDGRVSSGGQLGLAYLQGLASQYGIPLSRLTAFASKQGYQVGAKAQAATAPAAPAAPSAPVTDYERVSLKDIGSLQSYLASQLPYGSAGVNTSAQSPFGARAADVPGLKQLSDFMGVKKINSEKEIRNALNILGGIQSPIPAALAPRAGVTSYNSLNDYLKILGGGAMGSGSAGGGSNANPGGTQINPAGNSGGRGGRSDSYSPEIPTMPDPPEFQYTPGGPGASVDGSATSFRRKRSSARMAGLTTKGTGQFKISGQTSKSSGLNIGTP